MKSLLLFSIITLLTISAANAEMSPQVQQLQNKWSHIKYQVSEQERAAAFESLASEAEAIVNKAPDNAEARIWQGIILSTWAGEKGGLGALKLAKAAKASLESALEIDSAALSGSAFTSLGALYYQVPGWPVGFGSSKKAKKNLLNGLKENPDGIDSNFFYADFLLDQKEYEAAFDSFQQALNAPARPGREIADEGRKLEISEKLEIVNKHLK